MIAMSILAVGATSVLAIFVAAIDFHTRRVENNRITEIYNHARNHADIVFNAFDPSKLKPGDPSVPKPIVADLTDEKAELDPDPLIREAYRRFRGFKYEVKFVEDDLAVPGSSVVAEISIYRLSGQLDDSVLTTKEILTRSVISDYERLRSPSIEARDKEQRSGGGDRRNENGR